MNSLGDFEQISAPLCASVVPSENEGIRLAKSKNSSGFDSSLFYKSTLKVSKEDQPNLLTRLEREYDLKKQQQQQQKNS